MPLPKCQRKSQCSIVIFREFYVLWCNLLFPDTVQLSGSHFAHKHILVSFKQQFLMIWLLLLQHCLPDFSFQGRMNAVPFICRNKFPVNGTDIPRNQFKVQFIFFFANSSS
ncbi:hypothetical protein D3C87_1580760 [compost metagenome]